MKLGYIGLGKMGLNMVLRAQEQGHIVIAFNRSEEGRRAAKEKGARNIAGSIKELVSALPSPRVVWIMVSHAGVQEVLKELVPLLHKGDLIIDGGNCFYEETRRRAKILKKKRIRFMDIGVSGGPGGARSGACLMIGGDKKDFTKLAPLFRDLSVKNGFDYFGAHGAGHFVKMVHNGIEYGMMQAIGEGFAVMKKSDFNLNLTSITRLYNNGSVIESRLVGWLESAFRKYGEDLREVSGSVGYTGEGEWTVKTAETLKVPTPVIKDSFLFRVASKAKPSYVGKVLSALRNQFGQHDIKE